MLTTTTTSGEPAARGKSGAERPALMPENAPLTNFQNPGAKATPIATATESSAEKKCARVGGSFSVAT